MGRKPLSSRIQTIIALFTAASTLASRLQLIEHKELGAKHLSHEDSFIDFDERPTRYVRHSLAFSFRAKSRIQYLL